MAEDEHLLTRRGSLLQLGGIAAVALGVASGAEAAEGASAAGPAGVASGAVSCVLAPEQTEGPYYIARERVRRNVTEGKPGVPLTLRARVVNATTCAPLKGATVDIWHADAAGDYSGFGAGAGDGSFCRGIQPTDAHGLALFQTIYPGWYPGRAVHIHVKVHVRGNVVHTGQLYFPDAVTDAVFRGRVPYLKRPARDTRNAADAIFRNGGSKSLLALRRAGKGYVASITMGVT
jgi:protocatechuate 3,4-dioxygenase beta subunit